ncbi:MAG: hypothetical protein SVU32_08655 [Candidatus Nanohaloarchaea archaeon]|nr:hypothetical protein [Candidatus Nanohaloarchaea archaeon]
MKREYAVSALIVLVTLAGGVLGQVLVFEHATEAYFTVLQAGVVAAGLYFLIRSERVWQAQEQVSISMGEVASHLRLIGIGLLFYLLNHLPHIAWHAEELEVFGLHHGFWIGLFHSWSLASFGAISYGLYRFWKTTGG